MEKEDLFGKYCDVASAYLDSINYNNGNNFIVSLPLFRKEEDKVYICFYIEKKDGIYASRPLDWLLIDIDSYKVYKFYSCNNHYDIKKELVDEMNILVSPFCYLQLVYYDFIYVKYLYEKSGKYLFDEVFDKNYKTIDNIKMLYQDGRYIKYTEYVKRNIVNYTFDKNGVDKFMDDFNALVSESLIKYFNNILNKIEKGEDFQTDLSNYLDIAKFMCNQDVQVIDAFDNVLDSQNNALTDCLKLFNNKIIPKRKNERLKKFGEDFFENNIK